MGTLRKYLGSLLGHPKEEEELPTPAGLSMSHLALSQAMLLRSHDKTERQKQMILNVLFENTAFSELTNAQRIQLVDMFVPVEVKEGELLFRQGDCGQYFYIVEDGECEVYVQRLQHPPYRVATVHNGSSFGELALMYNGYRRATLLATKDTKLWALDRETFQEVMSTGSRELQRMFDKYAVMVEGPPGTRPQPYLTLDAFTAAFTQHRDGSLSSEELEAENARLRVLFKMVDRDNTGMITFAEFALFTHIMANPDPEFEIAFRYFDRLSNGQVSKQEFVNTLLQNSSSIADENSGDDDNSFLDFDCDVIDRFFGPKGHERTLTFPEFAEFFIRYQIEYAHQLFRRLDTENKGRIAVDDFLKIVPRMGDVRGPTYAPYFLECLENKGYVYFAEFVAFQNFLHHLPAIERVLRATFNKFPNTIINKNVFRALVRAHAVTTFSPLESAICFRVFGTARFTIITRDSFRRHSVSWPLSEQITEKDDGTIDIDEKLLGIDKSHLGGHQAEVRLHLLMMSGREFLTNAALGAVAAGTGAFLVFPLDAIKTRMQFSRRHPVVPGRCIYKNSWDCFRHILREQGGIRGLYRGVLPPVLGVTPEKMTKIFVNDQLRSIFETNSEQGEIHLPLEVLAGAGAGACQVIFTNPIEILKIRSQLQCEPMPLKGGKPPVLDPPKGMIALAREMGLTGLYRGTGACLLRDISFSAIYFPAYAYLKQALQHPDDGTLSPVGLLLAGGAAAIPAALFTTPLDVLKTRLQAKPITTGDWRINKELKYRSLADCASKTFRHEGIRAFWKGAGMRVLLWSPQFAVSLFMYEALQRNFFPELFPMPLTHIPVNSRDFTAFRTERLSERLRLVENELHILHLGPGLARSKTGRPMSPPPAPDSAPGSGTSSFT